jgi:glutathione synthase/RimK-type ligase-like ATP-grasp enzyme
VGDRSLPLEEFSAVYTRLMDDRNLPELRGHPADSPLRRYCRGLHDALMRWMEISPALVINRCAPMGSNASKPYQAQLIQKHGFRVPETLITTAPELVRDFRERHGRLVYKSVSAARSVVQTLRDEDLERLETIRWCPTQFQAYVEGTDIRVHTIGARVHATAISTAATDYRYAARQAGEPAKLREVRLADALAERCVDLSRSLGLVFAGLDLKVTPDDEVYCFEVNPCPAFSYYEANTDQPISQAVADCLIDAGRA